MSSPEDRLRAAGATSFKSSQVAIPLLSLINAATLAGTAVPREWHVDELIPSMTVTLLSGDGGTGKSLLALQLAAATTIGGYWVGRPVKAGACLYISAEDDIDELHRRLIDIAAAAKVTLADLAGLEILPLAGKHALLAVPDGKSSNVLKPTKLYEALDRVLGQMQPALVILDTLADLFGGEENQRAQARQFVGLLRGLCIRHKTTVLVLAHPSIAGIASGTGSSGSTAWNNSVRSRLYLNRVKGDDDAEADPDVRVLRTVKANYGRVGQEIRLRWHSGAFSANAPTSDSFTVLAAKIEAERVFLDMLAAYEAQGRYVSATPSANFAPAIFAKDGSAKGINKRGMTEVMNRLFEAKRIQVIEYGPPSKRRCRIAATTIGAAE